MLNTFVILIIYRTEPSHDDDIKNCEFFGANLRELVASDGAFSNSNSDMIDRTYLFLKMKFYLNNLLYHFDKFSLTCIF